MGYTALELKLLQNVEKFFLIAKQIADDLTDHPETSGNEIRSNESYCQVLRSYGYEPNANYVEVPYSFYAESRKKRLHKAVLMSEYDALPEIGHACGHSLSGAASLLAFFALEEESDDRLLAVDLLGTPAEEGRGGKIDLLKKKAFDEYEFAAMVHMDSINSTYSQTLASNDIYLTFTGKAAHASIEPEKGINALNAARLYMDAMDMWRQHIPRGTQFHGIIEKGGDVPNVIPDSVVLDYYFRAQNLSDLERINDIAVNCAKGAEMATGTVLTYMQRYHTFADLSIPSASKELMTSIFNDLNLEVEEIDGPAGSTDAGNVDQLIPVFHPTVSITDGIRIPLHHKDFSSLLKEEKAYDALMNSAKYLVLLVCRLSEHPELLAEIQSEHRLYRQSRKV